jgi:hypothetical protein
VEGRAVQTGEKNSIAFLKESNLRAMDEGEEEGE